MNDLSNVIEYSVRKSRGRSFNVLRFALPIIFIAPSIVISSVLAGMYGLTVGPIALIVLVAASMTYCSLTFRRIDYDYRIIGNELYFSVIYNSRKRKELGSIDISRLEVFAPYVGKYLAEANRLTYAAVHDFSSSVNDPNVFYAVQNDEESGNKTMYIFNASEKMLKLIKTYNRKAIINYPNE